MTKVRAAVARARGRATKAEERAMAENMMLLTVRWERSVIMRVGKSSQKSTQVNCEKDRVVRMVHVERMRLGFLIL